METWPVPEEALREGVVNAVIHEDYSSGTPIQIRVYDDRVALWNPGELPAGWTMAELLGEHSSQPFNPDIANAFFRAGMIEAWGCGIQRILRACREAESPVPDLRFDCGGLRLEFAFSIASAVADWGGANLYHGPGLGKRLGKTPAFIVRAMLTNPGVTTVELARFLRISTTAVDKNIKRLKNRGYVQRAGPSRGGYWRVTSSPG